MIFTLTTLITITTLVVAVGVLVRWIRFYVGLMDDDIYELCEENADLHAEISYLEHCLNPTEGR